MSRHRFLGKYVWMIVTWHEISWRALFVRLVAVQDVVLILADWAAFVYTVVLLVLLPDRLIVLHGLLATWAIQLWALTLFNVVVLAPQGCAAPAEVLVLYSIFYKLPSLLVLRVHAMAYNLLYYTPCVRNKRGVKRRLRAGDPVPAHLLAAMARTWPGAPARDTGLGVTRRPGDTRRSGPGAGAASINPRPGPPPVPTRDTRRAGPATGPRPGPPPTPMLSPRSPPPPSYRSAVTAADSTSARRPAARSPSRAAGPLAPPAVPPRRTAAGASRPGRASAGSSTPDETRHYPW